jgi:O-antigen ligase
MKLLSILLLLILCAHSFYNLEHGFYINEIFALYGFIVYISRKYYKQLKFDINNPISVLNWFLIILFLRIVLSLILNTVFDLYIFLRTISVFYSVFIFFLGIHIANNIKINRYIYYPYLIATALVGWFHGLYISVILYQGKVNRLFIISLLLAGGGMLIREDKLTTFCILLLWIIWFLFEKKQNLLSILRKRMGIILFISVLSSILFIYFAYKDTFIQFSNHGYDVFENDIDRNSYWRLMYWYYLIEQTINQYVFWGMGFGGKIFSHNESAIQGWLVNNFDNDYMEYVLGPHNSLIFLFTRTGLLGLVAFLLVLSAFAKYFIKHININRKYMYIYIAINMVMLFNVTLESPFFSIYYWTALGLAYGYLNKEKFILKYKNKKINYDK